MIESTIFAMQIACAVVMITGSALSFMQLAQRKPGDRFNFSTANDFEIDYRRVLAFSKLRTR